MGRNYDTDAEKRTIDVWVCKTCGKAWPTKSKIGNWTEADAEKAARTCCSENSICPFCGVNRTQYPHRACDDCATKRNRERWLECEIRAWPDGTPAVEQTGDRWFWSDADLYEYCAEEGINPRDMMLRIGQKAKVPLFEPADFWEDALDQDDFQTDDPECKRLVDALNEWAQAKIVSWTVGPYRIDPETLDNVEVES